MPSSRDDSASSMPKTLENPDFYAMEGEIIHGKAITFKEMLQYYGAPRSTNDQSHSRGKEGRTGGYRSDNSSHNSDGGHITSDDSDNHKSHSNYTDRAESDCSKITEEGPFDRKPDIDHLDHLDYLDYQKMILEVKGAIFKNKVELKKEKIRLQRQLRDSQKQQAEGENRPGNDPNRLFTEDQTNLRLSLKLLEEKRRQIRRDRKMIYKTNYPSRGYLSESRLSQERKERMLRERVWDLKHPQEMSRQVHSAEAESLPGPVNQ